MSSTTQEARNKATAETIDSLYAISQLLNTGLDRTALMSCVAMIEGGANPEALAVSLSPLNSPCEA
ncbi:mitotic-spindle organizing gamma-tubulin ring associated-domain-containing protein, partial [Mrakia frigida]|uniref:mitotic-spindle organizing protein 1 n=1 Tax=Mrakia frigida TaxID=29902 RepID=UPI003FCC2055